jgi:hypothetical protein
MREILSSNGFWARETRGTLVKSPVEFVVGTLRQLEIAPPDGLPFAVLAAGMGQNLFSPPNVKGWPGGNAWIDANTLLARKQFINRLARADEGPPQLSPLGIAGDEKARAQRLAREADRGLRSVHFDAAAWLGARTGSAPGGKESAAQMLLLALPPQSPPAAGDDALAFVRATLQDPVYQLK